MSEDIFELLEVDRDGVMCDEPDPHGSQPWAMGDTLSLPLTTPPPPSQPPTLTNWISFNMLQKILHSQHTWTDPVENSYLENISPFPSTNKLRMLNQDVLLYFSLSPAPLALLSPSNPSLHTWKPRSPPQGILWAESSMKQPTFTYLADENYC